MSVLQQVLHEAADAGASEVFFEAGEPPRVRSHGGTYVLGPTWSERELFDALEPMLSPEQLAELAVGNVVEFHVDVEAGRWTLLGQPTDEGVVVRGRFLSLERADGLGSPLVLPPLEPFEPGRVEAPPAPLQSSSGFERDPGVRSGFDDPLGWLIRNDEQRERSTVAPLDELEDVSTDRWSDLPDLPELLDPGLDDDTSPRIRLDEVLEAARPDKHPTASALATLDGDGDDPFVGYERVIVPGTLCVIQGYGVAEALAQHLDGGAYTVIDDERATLDVSEPGATFVVRLEDPSAVLGWILRRLEEGGRVVVETHARSLEGARRILLGTTHGPRAEVWLDAHPIVWVSWHDGEWIVRS